MAAYRRTRVVLGVMGVVSLLAACGQNALPTPGAIQRTALAATALAAIPTAAVLNPTITPTPAPSGTPAPPTLTPAPTWTPAPSSEYTVKSGDTLLSIAYDHKVSMAAIMLLNDMGDSQVVKLGQVLKVPGGASWDGEGVFWIVYIVQPGEALSTVAGKFGVSTVELVRINNITDQGAIAIGQKLVIPLTGPVAAPSPTATG